MNSNLAVKHPEGQDLEQQFQQKIQAVKIIQVVNPATYEQAGKLWKDATALEKEVDAYWDSLCDSAHKTWKGLVAKRDAMLKPIAAKKKEQEASAKAWKAEEDRKQREETARIQEAARKAAEDEQLRAAEELEKEGRKEEAEAVVSAPVVPMVPVAPSQVPKGLGMMTRTPPWSARVDNLRALLEAVMAGKAPIETIQPNQVFLNGQARLMKKPDLYPGVVGVQQ